MALRTKPMTPAEIVQMMRSYSADDGLTAIELAAKYGISVWTFHNIRRKLNVPSKRGRTVWRMVSDDDLKAAKQALKGK